eukprot:gene53956-18151_t
MAARLGGAGDCGPPCDPYERPASCSRIACTHTFQDYRVSVDPDVDTATLGYTKDEFGFPLS